MICFEDIIPQISLVLSGEHSAINLKLFLTVRKHLPQKPHSGLFTVVRGSLAQKVRDVHRGRNIQIVNIAMESTFYTFFL